MCCTFLVTGELFPQCPEYAVIPAYFDKEAIYGNGS